MEKNIIYSTMNSIKDCYEPKYIETEMNNTTDIEEESLDMGGISM